jgi:hypothetical protein
VSESQREALMADIWRRAERKRMSCCTTMCKGMFAEK